MLIPSCFETIRYKLILIELLIYFSFFIGIIKRHFCHLIELKVQLNFI